MLSLFWIGNINNKSWELSGKGQEQLPIKLQWTSKHSDYNFEFHFSLNDITSLKKIVGSKYREEIYKRMLNIF